MALQILYEAVAIEQQPKSHEKAKGALDILILIETNLQRTRALAEMIVLVY